MSGSVVGVTDTDVGYASQSNSSLDVAWVHGPMGDIGIILKVGYYAIDDLMLLRSMLGTFELVTQV